MAKNDYFGFYWDGINEWAFYCLPNSSVYLNHNHVLKLQTISNGVYVNNRVGIGTTNPWCPLVVKSYVSTYLGQHDYWHSALNLHIPHCCESN